MKFHFALIYPEVKTSYDITNTVLDPLRDYLEGLNKSIAHYDKLFKINDYCLDLYISATRKQMDFVKGPITLSKRKRVEFVIFIPYKKFDSYTKTMCYVLDNIAQGIIFIFNKYKTDSTGVQEVTDKLKALIVSDPEKYRKWTKSE